MFEVTDRKWRGVGTIPAQRLQAAAGLSSGHDAERLFDVGGMQVLESSECISGLILQGIKKPHDCPAFGKTCTPERPLGATMVSSEGACAAYYLYGRHRHARRPPSASCRECQMITNTRATKLDRRQCFGQLPGAVDGVSDAVLLGHGSGGKLTRRLAQAGVSAGLRQRHPHAWKTRPRSISAAASHVEQRQRPCRQLPRLAFTTDSFVVRPLFFPGGNIGQLAVHGTVNDLAVGGATPLFLSAAFILEEGLPMDDLRRIVAAMQEACREAGVQLVTGDTKVVDAARADQDCSSPRPGSAWCPRAGRCRCAMPGREIGSSFPGTIGDHGIAIMSVREGIEFETVLESDTAPLDDLTSAMLDACPSIRGHARSDARRLVERAERDGGRLARGHRAGRRHDAHPAARSAAACEMLGLDPLYVANEGKLLAVVPAADAERLLEAMRRHPLGARAAVIGKWWRIIRAW